MFDWFVVRLFAGLVFCSFVGFFVCFFFVGIFIFSFCLCRFMIWYVFILYYVCLLSFWRFIIYFWNFVVLYRHFLAVIPSGMKSLQEFCLISPQNPIFSSNFFFLIPNILIHNDTACNPRQTTLTGWAGRAEQERTEWRSLSSPRTTK